MDGPNLTISERQLLPTAAGCTSGIVADFNTTASVQCAVCLRVATGKPIFATGWALFVADEGEARRPPYRRCADCRAKRLHPQLSLDEMQS